MAQRARRPDQRSEAAARYRGWYFTGTWRRLRTAHLAGEPWCRTCALAGRRTPGSTVDHITPHRGDWALFTDRSNLQTLCDIHHGDKQRIERGGRPRAVIGADGWPTG